MVNEKRNDQGWPVFYNNRWLHNIFLIHPAVGDCLQNNAGKFLHQPGAMFLFYKTDPSPRQNLLARERHV